MDKNENQDGMFQSEIESLKKGMVSLRGAIESEYKKRLRSFDDNKLIFLKRDRDSVSKVLNLLFQLKPLSKETDTKNIKNKKIKNLLKDSLKNLIEITEILNEEIETLNQKKTGEDDLIPKKNLDILYLTLKYLKNLNIKKKLELRSSRMNNE